MNRFFRGAIACALMFAVTVPGEALAWGGQGHRLIGELAYKRLTPRAKAMVDRLLALSPQQEGAEQCPAKTLAEASVWADCVRGTKIAAYGYMSELHYVNRPVNGAAPRGSFCPAANCVTEAVRRAELVLGDRSSPKLSRLLALEQLAHFLEDMHQPLHVGDNGDKGGNAVQVAPFGDGRARNLHSLWDGDLVAAAVGREGERVSLVRSLMAKNGKTWKRGTIEQWALEGWKISGGFAYAHLATPPAPGAATANGGQIGEDYVEAAEPLVRRQIAKAAIRLAYVINKAAYRAR